MAKKSVKKQENQNKKEYLIEVVDGHVQTAVSISHFLRFLGYNTVETYDNETAVRLALDEKPDLILIDTTLDGARGEEVAEEIVEKVSNAKIIFMGSNSRVTKGVVGKIKKPIDNEELEKIVKKILR